MYFCIKRDEKHNYRKMRLVDTVCLIWYVNKYVTCNYIQQYNQIYNFSISLNV